MRKLFDNPLAPLAVLVLLVVGASAVAQGDVSGGSAGGLTQGTADLLYAAISHAHAASDITSGTLGTARGGTGNGTGLAATATALAANGTNCSAGNYPQGVDASGNAEGCTAAPTTASPVFTGVVGLGGSTSSYGGIYANATTSGQTWITDATGAVNTLKVGIVDFQSGSFSSNAPVVRIDARVKVLQGQGVDFYSGADIQSGSVVAIVRAGSGSPEGVLTAPVGSLYLRTNGGAGTTLYIKESGSGNTGWVGK